MNCIPFKILIIVLNEFVLSMCSTMSPYLVPDFIRNNVSMRIVKGTKANLGDFPYQVSFKQGGPIYSNFCGGSIIKPKVVVSAAHCFTYMSKGVCESLWRGRAAPRHFSDMHVVAASLQNAITKSTPSHVQWRTIEDIKYPDDYDYPDEDIAIIIVNKEWEFNQYVAPISLAGQYKDYGDMLCVVSGYGLIENNKQSEVLMYALPTVISVKECNAVYYKKTHHFICSEKIKNCVHSGDSGGPLVCRNTKDPNDGGKGVLVGIISASHQHFDMYTRVTAYRRYIDRNYSNIIKPTIPLLLIVICYCAVIKLK